MSDEPEKLQRQLEEATAADDIANAAANASLDADAASLRETWLAFGELLDTANPPSDEPIELPQVSRRKSSARWLAAAAMLAASLLVAVTLVWISSEPNQIAKPDEKKTPQVEQPKAVAVVANELQWDDTIDEQLAQAGQNIVQVQQDWYQLSEPFSSLQDGLSEMEDDMDQSTL
jgi:hypothetical protein